MTKKLGYLHTHPWLTFTVDFRKAPPSFWAALGECKSKCEHLAGVPLRPDIARTLHSVYLAKGVWGTTAIEGNTLSEKEVLKHVQGKLEVAPSKEYLKQEIDNIIQEANGMLERVIDGEPLILSLERIKQINKTVLHELPLQPGVVPGVIRTYSVGVMTYQGAPWQECEYLLTKLCDWLNGTDFSPQAGLTVGHMAILKAIIAHLYIEWIHPFGDGNGRTGRLVEVQTLLASGTPSPACQLLSNHYNQTRQEYLAQLRAASESGGDVLPFISYAINGFMEGLCEQLAYVRKLQMEIAWINYVHDHFRSKSSKSSQRQKHLLLDVFEREEPVEISEIDQLSPRLAKAYAGMHPRTSLRDVEVLESEGLLIREGKKIRANHDLISRFLPIKVADLNFGSPAQT
ncbi:MAG: Fic family protein [Candidatus Korobacteraceae bacterium]